MATICSSMERGASASASCNRQVTPSPANRQAAEDSSAWVERSPGEPVAVGVRQQFEPPTGQRPTQRLAGYVPCRPRLVVRENAVHFHERQGLAIEPPVERKRSADVPPQRNALMAERGRCTAPPEDDDRHTADVEMRRTAPGRTRRRERLPPHRRYANR